MDKREVQLGLRVLQADQWLEVGVVVAPVGLKGPKWRGPFVTEVTAFTGRPASAARQAPEVLVAVVAVTEVRADQSIRRAPARVPVGAVGSAGAPFKWCDVAPWIG